MCFCCCVLSAGQEGGGAKRLRSSSCAKHYFAYSLENCYTLGDNCRMNFNAVTDQRDIEDTYASLRGHQDRQQPPALHRYPLPPACHCPFSCVVLILVLCSCCTAALHAVGCRYLVAFQAAVERGGVSGLMCSYNAVRLKTFIFCACRSSSLISPHWSCYTIRKLCHYSRLRARA